MRRVERQTPGAGSAGDRCTAERRRDRARVLGITGEIQWSEDPGVGDTYCRVLQSAAVCSGDNMQTADISRNKSHQSFNSTISCIPPAQALHRILYLYLQSFK